MSGTSTSEDTGQARALDDDAELAEALIADGFDPPPYVGEVFIDESTPSAPGARSTTTTITALGKTVTGWQARVTRREFDAAGRVVRTGRGLLYVHHLLSGKYPFRYRRAADPAPDDQPVGLEKAFIDGWMACRSAYGATDPEDVGHGVECPRAHGDRECHCNEDAVREWAELEWADRPDTSSAVQAPDVAALLAKCDEIDRQGHSKLRGTFSTADIRALLGTDTTPAVAS